MAQTNTMAITEPSSLMDFVMNKGHGVKGLSETGLKTLPAQYVQPIQERINVDDALAAEGEGQTIIPIIDMSSAEELMICEAAERWGFFQVVNHGVPLEVLEKVLAAARRFFAMPAEEKNKYSKENSPSNNVRYGTSFTPHAEKALEWKDFLSLFYVSHKEAYALWPPSCRDEVVEFMKKSEGFIKKLLKVLLKRLNVKEIDTIERENLLMGSKRINMNYYPICPNPNLTVGVGRHSDVSTLTVLLQDVIGGLYVRDHEKRDTWIHVPPVKGSLVINVGDVLQIISNGRYKSAEHRVAANGSSDRISVPIFVNPRPSDIISPLPEVLASSGEKPIYKEVLYSDYVKHFFRKGHDGKSTIDFASIKV